VLLDELRADFRDEFINDALDGLERERRERYPSVEAVAEFGAEGALDCAAPAALRDALLLLLESYLRVRHLARARVGRHDEGDGVRLGVLAHVEAYELDAEGECELLREFRFADSGRAGEEERADGLVRVSES